MDFKRLFYGSRDVFGLDVGSSCVKAVQLRQDEQGYKVITAGWTEIAQDNQDGQVKIADVVNAIRRCIKTAQIRTKYAVCGISGPSVALRRFRFPSVGVEEVETAVLFEAQQVCPFEKGQYIVDYQLYKNNTFGDLAEANKSQERGEIRGVLAAATMGVIGYKSQVVKAASLNCVLIDVEGLALLNCFLEFEKEQRQEPIGIICVGSKFTNFAILGSDGVPFVRDIPHAADEIVADIASEHNISLQVVRDILDGGSDGDVSGVKAGMKTAAGRLTGDILRTLRHFSAQEGQKVRKMYVCGGFARAKGFVEHLNSQLPGEAVLWNPFDRMGFESGGRSVKMLKEHGCRLALAAGLAMRTI